MTPQPGDIWQYTQPNRDDNGLTVLIHEYMGCHPSHFSAGNEYSYFGYDMIAGEYDEFIFNAENMVYWRKLA